MSISLLTTKLHFPQVRSNHVPRPRLMELLNTGLKGPLTLISAPAGYGKTTLMSEWRAYDSGCSYPLAWLSLDSDDNELGRFLAYLVAAIGMVQPGFGEITLASIQTPQPPPPHAIMTNLINELSEINRSFVLVLDDYHVISTQMIHESVAFLLDHLPPQMHLVILSRADPPFPLARLRARNQMTDIRAIDLRFTSDEAKKFLNEVMRLTIATEEIDILERRTEGWIAGLQLAALSLHGRDNPAQFIATFGGGNNYIVDYLVEEVLDRQPEPLRIFLQQTSILDHLTGPLCDAVTGQTGGQATLEQLERSNLFISPIVGECCWYRYHHLFADVMQNRLRQMYPGMLTELHNRASEWFEQNQYIGDAIHHASVAGNRERVASLIEQNAMSMLLNGELATLRNWLDMVGGQETRRPWLSVFRAWVLVHTGQQEASANLLDQLERSDLPGLDPDRWAEIPGHIAAIRSHIAAYRWDAAGAIDFAQAALAKLPDNDLPTRSYVSQALGGAYLLIDDLESASRWLTEAYRIGRAAGNLHVAVLSTYMLANIQADRGQLHQAVETYQNALKLATASSGRLLPVAARAFNGLAQVYYEWNDLEAASQCAIQCIELAQKWGNYNALVSAYVTLGRVKRAQGNMEDALTCLDEAKQLTDDHSLAPGGKGGVDISQVVHWLAINNLAAAERWAQKSGFKIDDEIPPLREGEYSTYARVLLARNQIDAALALLNRLLPVAESAGKVGAVIGLLILQSLALQAKQEPTQAIKSLERALTLAQPEGYLRIFVDGGNKIAELLRRAGSQGISPRDVARLLTVFACVPDKDIPNSQPLIEPLSERELEVLHLIAVGKSNQEIAAQLVLSTGTVKSHLNHIFNKLNVDSRTQCVARARELMLIS